MSQTPEQAQHAHRIAVSRKRRALAAELSGLTREQLRERLAVAAEKAGSKLNKTRAQVERAVLDLEQPTPAIES